MNSLGHLSIQVIPHMTILGSGEDAMPLSIFLVNIRNKARGSSRGQRRAGM